MSVPKSAIERAGNNWGQAGLVDANGQPMRSNKNSYLNGDGGGGGDVTSRITVEQNVKGLNIWVALLTAGLCGAFLFLLQRIDDRFDRADIANTEMAEQITAVRVEDAKQGAGIAEILERIRGNDDVKASPRIKQPNPVR